MKVPARTSAPAPTNEAEERSSLPRLIVICGLSGAGTSTALRILQDQGVYCIDNLPLNLWTETLTRPCLQKQTLALTIDIRNLHTLDGSDGSQAALRVIEAAGKYRSIMIVSLAAAPAELLQRYSATRRRHPLGEGLALGDALRAEADRMQPLQEQAAWQIDTTEFTPNDLHMRLAALLGAEDEPLVTVLSFSFRNGLPPSADFLFDARMLRNPHYDPDLRGMTGMDQSVANYVSADPAWDDLLARTTELVLLGLPRFRKAGKAYVTFAIGCTGGKHRSVFFAEQLAQNLSLNGQRCLIEHREQAVEPRLLNPAC